MLTQKVNKLSIVNINHKNHKEKESEVTFIKHIQILSQILLTLLHDPLLKPVQIKRMRVMDTIGVHPSIEIREIATSTIPIEYAIDAMAAESS